MHKRTYLNACLVLALAAGASQALAAPGASEMAGDVAVLQASRRAPVTPASPTPTRRSRR